MDTKRKRNISYEFNFTPKRIIYRKTFGKNESFWYDI